MIWKLSNWKKLQPSPKVTWPSIRPNTEYHENLLDLNSYLDPTNIEAENDEMLTEKSFNGTILSGTRLNQGQLVNRFRA